MFQTKFENKNKLHIFIPCTFSALHVHLAVQKRELESRCHICYTLNRRAADGLFNKWLSKITVYAHSQRSIRKLCL